MRNRLWMIPLAALTLAALACSGPAAGDGGGGGASAPKVLYRETFEDPDSGWGTGTDDTSSLEYDGGEYVFKILDQDWLIWGTADDKDYSNIRLTVTARNIGASADPAFGIICNYQDDKNFYYLGMGSDGYYAISKYVDDQLTVLTDADGQWVVSDKISLNQASYDLQADCSGGRLALSVGGTQIASVQDTAFTRGNVGLFVKSFEGTAVDVRFDNFVVTELP